MASVSTADVNRRGPRLPRHFRSSLHLSNPIVSTSSPTDSRISLYGMPFRPNFIFWSRFYCKYQWLPPIYGAFIICGNKCMIFIGYLSKTLAALYICQQEQWATDRPQFFCLRWLFHSVVEEPRQRHSCERTSQIRNPSHAPAGPYRSTVPQLFATASG